MGPTSLPDARTTDEATGGQEALEQGREQEDSHDVQAMHDRHDMHDRHERGRGRPEAAMDTDGEQEDRSDDG